MKRTPYTRRVMLANLHSKGFGIGWKKEAISNAVFYGSMTIFAAAMAVIIWQLKLSK